VTGSPLRVLIVEDSEDDAALLVHELRRGGHEPTSVRVDTADAMRDALAKHPWQVVIADYHMPHFSAPEALAVLQASGLDLPFLIVSGRIGEETAVAAMKAGAHDYIMKGNLSRLVPAIERELREAEGRRERRRAEELVRRMAYYDRLTDLPNRALLHDLLQRAVAAGPRAPLALLLIDLDRFREINDTLGHHHGDLVLQQVGARLRGVLNAADAVSRLGGDEFAVLAPGADGSGASRVAAAILRALEEPFAIEGLPINVEASIGIALHPDHGADADTLLRRADVAMYAAKQSGNGYAVYASEHDQHTPRRLALMGELRAAIERNELLLHYQPTVSFKTGRIEGVEALVRWQHPVHGFIAPDQFIGAAEKTGLIKPLTLWVFEAAQRQCVAWRREGLDVAVAINLSARTLHDAQLPDQIAELVRRGGGSAPPLRLEVTESAIMAEPTRAREILLRLNEMGIRIAIDDFGTGYTSLGYLHKLPVDEIKIDRSFVLGMETDEDDATIVRSTIDLAHNLGLTVVAEGVENRAIWDRLAALGCNAAQGYYICRPIPADDLARWLHESPWGLKDVGSNAG